MIPESFIQELKFYSDIEQIVSSYVHLSKRGKISVGLCPFHNEKTPSFTVYPDTQSFYCFGCGAGGDVVSFIRRIENLEYVEAIRLLAQRAGLQMPDDTQNDEAARLKMRILELNRQAARFFHHNLTTPAGATGLRYFRERGLSDDTIKRFGLGYSLEGWSSLCDHLKGQGFTERELLEARVAAQGKSGKGCYDLFRGRAMFPIIDLRGNVIGFGGRVIGEGGPKYLNSPDTPVFKKSRNLFALNRAKSSKLDGLILAEGYMDVIALHQAGFDNAVATLGTSLTAEQTQLISKYCNEVTIAYDSDGAGQNATRRAINLFADVGVKIRVLKMEGAKDPDEYIKKFGATRFKLLLENCNNAIEFEISKLRAKYDVETADGKVNFLNEFSKLMAGIRNPVERDVYVKKVSGELAVSPEAVLQLIGTNVKRKVGSERKKQQRDLKMYVGAGAMGKSNPQRERNLRYALAEERLIALLLKNPDYYEYIAAKISPGDFVTDYNREIFEKISERLQQNQSIEMISLSSVLDIEDMAFVSGLFASQVSEKHPLSEADDYIKTILQKKNEKSSSEVAAMDERELGEYLRTIAARKK
ncbi:DNA primase [Harryflintia acetispora]|uniref:DNA primase n=1 Tax=Harryflintia acetispora TaxID=1849041 RepID=UPI0018979801|nr:DNA primase [Harryflintia acetispora]